MLLTAEAHVAGRTADDVLAARAGTHAGARPGPTLRRPRVACADPHVSRPRRDSPRGASCLLAAGITAVLCGLLLGAGRPRSAPASSPRPCRAPLAASCTARGCGSPNRAQRRPGYQRRPANRCAMHLTITNRSRAADRLADARGPAPGRRSAAGRGSCSTRWAAARRRTVSYRMPRPAARPLPRRPAARPAHRPVPSGRPAALVHRDQRVRRHPDRRPAAAGASRLGRTTSATNAGSHSVGAHGADDASTREYRTGDDLRKIHWRLIGAHRSADGAPGGAAVAGPDHRAARHRARSRTGADRVHASRAATSAATTVWNGRSALPRASAGG